MEFLNSPLQRAQELEGVVLENADTCESQRHLAAPIATAFAESGLYRIAAPADCGGEEVDPATQIETIETVSRFDGSAGWNLMIGIETFGLVAPCMTTCMDLIADPQVVMCSSTAAVGHAERVEGGFRVSGRWQFVSGCHNASVFGATVRLHENGAAIADTTNRYAMVPLGQYKILDTWNVSGLCGSGSHDVEVNDVFVPDDRIVAPIGGYKGDSALARFPLGPRLAYNKVGVSLGIARAGLDAFVDLANGKIPRFTSKSLRERPHAQRAIGDAEARLRSARAGVFTLLDEIWRVVIAGEQVKPELRALFHIACSDAVRGCAEAVEQVTEAAGTTANQRGHPLERIARDVRVVRQHVTVASHHIEDGGRMLLGLKPTGMMLAGL